MPGDRGRGRRGLSRRARARCSSSSWTGPSREIEAQSARIEEICRDRTPRSRSAWPQSDAERALLWKGRKEAAGAVGRLTPNWLLQDAVVPRSRAAADHARDDAPSVAGTRLVIANVFHAGDGNLHPIICYDDRRARRAGARQAGERGAASRLPRPGRQRHRRARRGPRQGQEPAPCSSRDADLNFMARLRRVFDPDCHDESRQALAIASRLRRGLPSRAPGAAAGSLDLSPTAMSAAAVVAHALEEIVGRGQVQCRSRRAGRGGGGRVIPRWLARPGTVEQVAQLLSLASAEGLAVTPAGAARASRSAIPRRVDLVLDLGRLTTVLAYVPEDMVADVQCGITLDAMAARLGQHGQRLPSIPRREAVDPWAASSPPRRRDRCASATARAATCCSASASSRPTA